MVGLSILLLKLANSAAAATRAPPGILSRISALFPAVLTTGLLKIAAWMAVWAVWVLRAIGVSGAISGALLVGSKGGILE